MRLALIARGLAACALATFAARPAAADIVTELEVGGTASNNTVATAESVQGAFSLDAPPTAFASGGNFSYATILGFGGGVSSDNPPSVNTDIDFYRFTTAGGRAYFDIDNTPFSFDAILSLFDAGGTLIAFDDDSPPPDAGSELGLDPFLGTVTLPGGTYYLAVTEFNNFPATPFTNATPLERPDSPAAFVAGGVRVSSATPGDSSFLQDGVQPLDPKPYTLILAVENAGSGPPPAAVPAPPAAVLGLVGAAALGLRRLARRRAA